jgi:hypothetical protein
MAFNFYNDTIAKTVNTKLDSGLITLTDIKTKTDLIPTIPAIETTSLAIKTKTDLIEITRQKIFNRSITFGKAAVPTATHWGDKYSIVPYIATSGNGDFGTDPNDEALLIGSSDTPTQLNKTKFIISRISMSYVTANSQYIIMLLYGTGTMAEAEMAEQFTTMNFRRSQPGVPECNINLDIVMPLLNVGTKVWMKVKGAYNNSQIYSLIDIIEFII